jgi:hypothetical protein
MIVPVKNFFLMSFTIVICLLFLFSPFTESKTYFPSNQIAIVAIADKDDALQAMLNGFELYGSFLNDIEFQQGYYLPLHGKTRAEAINYLGGGFEKNLAASIVDEYTCFIPELNCLAIKPVEGLPLLNKEDIPYLSCDEINNEHIIFSREFTSCYSPIDRYLYQVEIRLYQDHWKISALSLDEL